MNAKIETTKEIVKSLVSKGHLFSASKIIRRMANGGRYIRLGLSDNDYYIFHEYEVRDIRPCAYEGANRDHCFKLR